MFIIFHNSDDGDGGWSRIIKLGVDVKLPKLTADQHIEPVIFNTLDEAKVYVRDELGWDEKLCPVAKEIVL